MLSPEFLPGVLDCEPADALVIVRDISVRHAALRVRHALGALGARMVFAHLAIVAVALTLLRSRMKARAQRERGPGADHSGIVVLFTPRYFKSMLFLVGMYGMWNLWAGTNGFFFPYILRTVG